MKGFSLCDFVTLCETISFYEGIDGQEKEEDGGVIFVMVETSPLILHRKPGGCRMPFVSREG